MNAITRIHVKGFRSLRDVTLEPKRITVLIGANGAGKSNLLSLLRMLSLLHKGALRRYVGEAGGASALLHYGPKHTAEMSVRLDFEQDSGTSSYGARLGHGAGDSLLFLEEEATWRPTGQPSESRCALGAGHAESRLRDLPDDPARPLQRTVSWWLDQLSFFHFHDTSMSAALRQNSRAVDTANLRSDGSNLAAYLHALRSSETDAARAAWKRIQMLVRRVAPFLKELQPTPIEHSQPERAAIRLDWIDDRDERFGPHHLSDGTLRAIALITALAQPAARVPAFLSIDEPELGLHPSAIQLLASLVRSTSTRNQVLLATQSPALLDHFDPAEVVVVERRDGASHFDRLQPEALAEWLEDYRLSDLYDKNLLGGRP